jgi:hypothetical protein
MMQMFYLDVAYVYNDFKCFSGVFAGVSDAYFKCFICFQTYVVVVASRCFKLDRVLHLPPRLSSVSPRCQAWEDGDVPIGMGGPHVLAGGCSKLEMGRQAWDEGREAAARAFGQGASIETSWS